MDEWTRKQLMWEEHAQKWTPSTRKMITPIAATVRDHVTVEQRGMVTYITRIPKHQHNVETQERN